MGRKTLSDGPKNYHHGEEVNKKVYRISHGYLIKDGKLIKNNASTDCDLSEKSINHWVALSIIVG